jgi:hypothetical protein
MLTPDFDIHIEATFSYKPHLQNNIKPSIGSDDIAFRIRAENRRMRFVAEGGL